MPPNKQEEYRDTHTDHGVYTSVTYPTSKTWKFHWRTLIPKFLSREKVDNSDSY